MNKYLSGLLLLISLATLAQDRPSADENEKLPQNKEQLGKKSESPEFRPTEEVSADQELDFPADI